VTLTAVSVALIGGVSAAASAFAGTTSSARRFVVPAGSYLVASGSGRLLVLNPRGKLLRRGPRLAGRVQALALSPDRRSAYVSVYARPAHLYKVALGSGEKVLIAKAISPSLSPDKTELAYVTVAIQDDIEYRTALVIRDLQTGNLRTIAFPPGVPMDTPPPIIINWSPDGHSIVVFDGTDTRIVNVASAQTVDSQPAIPGAARAYAPVFVGPHTLVALLGCCIGSQQLTSIDLDTDAQTPFAQVGSPIENVRWLHGRTLLATTALHRLVRITQGRKAEAVTKLDIVAASP